MNVVVSKRMHAVFPTFQKSLQISEKSINLINISLYHVFAFLLAFVISINFENSW